MGKKLIIPGAIIISINMVITEASKKVKVSCTVMSDPLQSHGL